MCKNQGIMHAARSMGGEPLCRNRNAHMSTTIEKFRDEPLRCKRCDAKVLKMDILRHKRELRGAN